MAATILSIISTAYRATLEEQDDTVVWFTHALWGAGAEVDVLLRGNAVNYAVRSQDAAGLCFGARRQTQSPRVGEDVAKLAAKGARLLLVAEDLAERGIDAAELIAGVDPVPRASLPALLASYERVWSW